MPASVRLSSPLRCHQREIGESGICLVRENAASQELLGGRVSGLLQDPIRAVPIASVSPSCRPWQERIWSCMVGLDLVLAWPGWYWWELVTESAWVLELGLVVVGLVATGEGSVSFAFAPTFAFWKGLVVSQGSKVRFGLSSALVVRGSLVVHCGLGKSPWWPAQRWIHYVAAWRFAIHKTPTPP